VCYETTNSVLIFLPRVRRMAIDLTGVENIRLYKERQTCRRLFPRRDAPYEKTIRPEDAEERIAGAHAAGGVAKNKAGDSVSSVSERTQVDMKRSGGKWKIVVTDRLYRLLTGEKR
jgi:hypothetical protein